MGGFLISLILLVIMILPILFIVFLFIRKAVYYGTMDAYRAIKEIEKAQQSNQ